MRLLRLASHGLFAVALVAATLSTPSLAGARSIVGPMYNLMTRAIVGPAMSKVSIVGPAMLQAIAPMFHPRGVVTPSMIQSRKIVGPAMSEASIVGPAMLQASPKAQLIGPMFHPRGVVTPSMIQTRSATRGILTPTMSRAGIIAPSMISGIVGPAMAPASLQRPAHRSSLRGY